jgi:hypothetical protein
MMVSYMVVTVFASTTNYREDGWFKVSRKLRSTSSGVVGNFHSMTMTITITSSLERGRRGAVVELFIIHCELLEYCD